MEKVLKFKCPKCNNDLIEEIMSGAIVSTPVLKLTVTGGGCEPDYDYANAENYDGQIDRYQCAKCGFIVPAKSLEALSASEYMHEIKDGVSAAAT